MTLIAVLRHLVFAAGLALLSATVVRAMIAARVLDRPNERSAHSEPTPKGGGVGIIVAFMVGVIILYRFAAFARLADPYFLGVIGAAAASTGGTVLARGPVRVVDPLRTAGGFDHGSFEVDGHLVRFLNEYMTVDRDADRLATYPDVITTLSLSSGRPVSIAEMSEGVAVALFAIDRSRLPLSSGTRDRLALAEVERIMGVELLDPTEDRK